MSGHGESDWPGHFAASYIPSRSSDATRLPGSAKHLFPPPTTNPGHSVSSRRHSHVPQSSYNPGIFDPDGTQHHRHGQRVKTKGGVGRRVDTLNDDDELQFSDDDAFTGFGEDGDSEDDSDLDPQSPSGRRHTVAERGRALPRLDISSAETHRSIETPHRATGSTPIAIAAPTRRESYLEQEALSARGDRLGAYFPLHEDPNLRIQRSHPFHSASAQARKQSINLAQTATLQSRSPLPGDSFAPPRFDYNGPLSITAAARRHSHHPVSSSVYADVPSAKPSSPVDSSNIAWRTIRGFDTRPSRETTPSPMSASTTTPLPVPQRPVSRARRNLDDVDPLDTSLTAKSSHAQISGQQLSHMPRPESQPRCPPKTQPVPITPSMGKYYPSVYEQAQKRKMSDMSSETGNPYYSSEEDVAPDMLPSSSRTPASGRQSGRSSDGTLPDYPLGPRTPVSSSTHRGLNSSLFPGHQLGGMSMDPDSPRLDPLGSPGPVTPMDLNHSDFPLTGSLSYFESSRGRVPRP